MPGNSNLVDEDQSVAGIEGLLIQILRDAAQHGWSRSAVIHALENLIIAARNRSASSSPSLKDSAVIPRLDPSQTVRRNGTHINQLELSNVLLKTMPPASFELFRPHLRWVDLPFRYPLVTSNQTTPLVFFLESGLASAVEETNNTQTIEIGHIGREGVSAPHIVLMTDASPTDTFMQIAGDGYVLPASILQLILEQDAGVRRLLLNYVHCYGIQLGQSILANGRYSVSQRLARWLLMVHDRVNGLELPLTHELLAVMLGVRRPSITDQIHILEGEHAIKASRARIRILDRSVLRKFAGGCYGLPEQEYERLIGTRFARHDYGWQS